MSEQSKKISLIVALYNEAPVIEDTISKLTEYMRTNMSDHEWEIILVDDGSTDQTAEIVNRIIKNRDNFTLIRHKRNFGQGRAFRNAFEAAHSDILVTLDADLSYDPQYIRLLVNEVESNDADIAIASAFLPNSKIVNIPLHRRILTVCANKFLSWTSSLDLSATTCAVRAYSKAALEKLPLSSDGMEMNLEVILKAQVLGMHVTEIPATLKWSQSKKSKGKRRGRTPWDLLRTTLRYFFFGYLFNPNILFLPPLFVSFSVFLLYAISLLILVTGQFNSLMVYNEAPLMTAASGAIRWAFDTYPHAFYFLLASLGVSLFLFIAWFVTKQNKFYFEQTYSLNSSLFLAHKNHVRNSRNL